MQLICPRCSRTLAFSGEPPSFCLHCGQALNPVGTESTAAFPHEAVTLAPTESCGPAPACIPQTIGGYRLLRPLGSGGMGTVHEAEDTASGRRVALKLIAPDYTGSEDAVERFRREGRLASMMMKSWM